MKRSAILIAALCVALASLCSGNAQASTGYWNTTTSGLWSDKNNWWSTDTGPNQPASVPTSSDNAYFNSSSVNGPTEVQLGANHLVYKLNFNNTGSTLLRSSSSTDRTLTIYAGGIAVNAGAGAVTLGDATNAMPIALAAAQTWTNASSNALTVVNNLDLSTRLLTITGAGNTIIDGVISGTGASAITKTGAGNLTLTNANTYTGTTILNKNTGVTRLTITNRQALGTGTFEFAGSTWNAATLDLQLAGDGTANAEETVVGNNVKWNTGQGGGTINVGNNGTGAANKTIVMGSFLSPNAYENFTTSATGYKIQFTSGESGTLNFFAPTIGGDLEVIFTGGYTVGKAGSTFTASGTGSLTVLGTLSGAGAMAVTAATNMTLGGDNTYTGLTTVNANKTLTIKNDGALGTTDAGTTVANLGTLALSHATGITVTGEALSLTGNGVGGGGALRNVAGLNTWAGAIALAGTDHTIASDAGKLTIDVDSGYAIAGANKSLTLAGAGNGEIADAISLGTSGLTKTGAGTWILSAANEYSGATNVNQGKLLANNATGSATGTGAVNVAAGAFLGGDGIIGGPVSIASLATLAPGTSPGVLTINNTLTLAEGALFDFELATVDTSDKVVTSALILNGQQFDDFTFTTLSGFGPGDYVLFETANGVTGSLGSNVSGTLGSYTATLRTSGNDLLLTVIPEPGTLALLATALVGLLAYVWRKRK